MKLNSETYKKGAIHSSFFSVLAKGVAFMQHLLIAYYFGANTGTDLYFYLFNLVIMIGGMIQTITTSILIPQSMLLRHSISTKAEMKYLNAFMYSFIFIIFLLIFLVSLGGDKVPELITNFPTDEIKNIYLLCISYIDDTYGHQSVSDRNISFIQICFFTFSLQFVTEWRNYLCFTII